MDNGLPTPDPASLGVDVRDTLRPVSSPWIVFQRHTCEDFAKRALRIGAVFASSPSFRPSVVDQVEGRDVTRSEVADASAHSRKASVPILQASSPSSMSSPPESAREPSGIVVTKDVLAKSSLRIPVAEVRVEAPPSVPGRQLLGSPRVQRDEKAHAAGASGRNLRRIPGAFAGGIAVMVLASAGFVTLGRLHSRGRESLTTEGLSLPSAPPLAERQNGESPATMAGGAEPIMRTGAAVDSADPAGSTDGDDPGSVDPKKRFGRITIRSDAKHKVIYLDGKRMLGAGPRSLIVLCGMHSLAVGDRSLARNIEVPCDTEYVVSK